MSMPKLSLNRFTCLMIVSAAAYGKWLAGCQKPHCQDMKHICACTSLQTHKAEYLYRPIS